MASEPHTPASSAAADVLERPWDYDFFLAMRRIEASRPDMPRIGKSRTLRHDPIRFGQFLSLGFATSALEQAPEKDRGRKLLVRFSGLTGPNGPLPLRWTDFIRNRLRGIADPDLRGTRAQPGENVAATTSRDATLSEFIDIFHHRFISLFYRAWATAQKTADFDRAEDRTFAEWIASTYGAGLPEMESLDAVPGQQRLPFAGHLSCQTRHAAGLRGVLSAYFQTDVEVFTFAGQWIEIPAEQRCRLGESRATGVLGSTAIAGAKIWDRQMKFTLRLGPMRMAQFEQFLPGRTSHARLHAWLAFYTRQELYWEASIVLRREDVPAVQLGATGRLGYTTWLLSGPAAKDSSDFKVRGGGIEPGDNT